jgi:hypothetical protein
VRSKDKRDAAIDLLVAEGLSERGGDGTVYALAPEDQGGADGTR